jgi:hypothetical protein
LGLHLGFGDWQVSSMFVVLVVNGVGAWFCGHKLIQFRWTTVSTSFALKTVHLVEARSKLMLSQLHLDHSFALMLSNVHEAREPRAHDELETPLFSPEQKELRVYAVRSCFGGLDSCSWLEGCSHQEVQDLYAWALQAFPSSPLLHVFIARYLFTYRRNRHLCMQHLKLAEVHVCVGVCC